MHDSQLRKWPLLALLSLTAQACTGQITGARVDDGARPPVAGEAGGGRGGTAPGGAAGTSAMPATTCPLPDRRIWKLTPAQYERSLEALLGSKLDVAAALSTSLTLTERRFRNEANHLELGDAHVEMLFQLSEPLALQALTKARVGTPCLSSAAPDARCVSDFLDDFASRAFRRPLTDVEHDAYLAFVAQLREEFDLDTALTQVLAAIFMSPHVLFRTELGGADAEPATPVKLTPFEVASALSYWLTDGAPDAELSAAARDGSLDDPGVLRAQARRLLANEEGAVALPRMFAEIFRLTEVLEVGKSTLLFPEFDEVLARTMVAAGERFFADVLWQNDGRFATLFTAEHAFANQALASIYDVMGPTGAALERIALPPERHGLLSHPALMAALSRSDRTDIVLRGRYVREEILCQTVPPPPGDVDAVLPDADEGTLTQREVLEGIHGQPQCSGCHRLMDPLGFPFEVFDAVGRPRERDNGAPIDTSASLTGTSNDGAFADAVALSQRLLGARETQRCFVQHTLQYAFGQTAQEVSPCALEGLTTRLLQEGGDLKAMLLELIEAPAYVFRK